MNKKIIFSSLDESEDNEFWLDDERRNLQIETDGEIVAIADLGFWYGRRSGYRLLGTNIANILDFLGCPDAEFWVDRYDVRARLAHHDGDHYVVYRQFKSSVGDLAKERFLDKVYCGDVTHEDILRYTKSIRPLVAKVYGW